MNLAKLCEQGAAMGREARTSQTGEPIVESAGDAFSAIEDEARVDLCADERSPRLCGDRS